MRKALLTMKLLLLMAFVVMGCAPVGAPSQPGTGAAPGAAAPQKILHIINRGEPPSLAAKSLVQGGSALGIPPRFFNTTFDIVDVREIRHPHLAEALPQLNTDTWRIFPDGRMETRYILKPNLAWHDGTPLHAEDFVFAHRVYKTPELGSATTRPMAQMQEIFAPDARTVVIRWSEPFAEAAELGTTFQGLPRHLLEEDFRTMDSVAFTGHPFWTRDYVGLGAYKLDRWEPGAFLAGSAFDRYALGRPQIDQIRILIVNDPQTALANVLAGEVHFVTNFTFSVDQGQILEREFAQNQAGRVMYSPTQRRLGLIQQRPQDQQPKALADVRVRYAVAHGLDHQSRVDVLDGGKGQVAHALTHSGVPWYAEVDRAILKHEHDPRRAQDLMAEAGWTRAADGFFVDSAGNRFTMQVASSAGGKNEQEAAVYVDSLRRVGFDAVQHAVPVAQIEDAEARARLSGLALRGAGESLGTYISAQIPGPENRWRGNNRPGWSNAEYDRRFATLERTFAQNERTALIAQMERIITVDRAVIPNTWESLVNSVAAGLHGPEPRGTPDAGGAEGWVHTWEWRS